MLRDRRLLIESMLQSPQEAIHLAILADLYEERGMDARASALRLAYSLRQVPWPKGPDEACRRLWVDRPQRPADTAPAAYQYDWLGRVRESQTMASLAGDSLGLSGGSSNMDSIWPDCPGWDGLGRLPAVAPALRLLCQGRPMWARHAVRCELYSCGVITARERDEDARGHEMGDLMLFEAEADSRPRPTRTAEWLEQLAWQAAHLWLLRGGAAGRAVNLMQQAERAHATPAYLAYRKQRTDAGARAALYERAVARTYCRDVLRAFLSAGPREIAKGLRAEPAPGRAA